MIIEDKIINAECEIGGNIGRVVGEAVEFALQYNCVVMLKFNGTVNAITKHTNVDSLIDGWYK